MKISAKVTFVHFLDVTLFLNMITPSKRQKSVDSLAFSGGIEMPAAENCKFFLSMCDLLVHTKNEKVLTASAKSICLY